MLDEFLGERQVKKKNLVVFVIAAKIDDSWRNVCASAYILISWCFYDHVRAASVDMSRCCHTSFRLSVSQKQAWVKTATIT